MSELTIPSLREMMDNGVHFGHTASRWNPKMKPYIYTERDRVHVINLEQTREQLERALTFLRKTAQEGGTILFIGTKRQAKELVKETANAVGMPFMTERWFGGAMTNFSVLRKNVKLLEEMEAAEQKGELEHLTKKERLILEEKKIKLYRLLEGVRNLSKLPQAVFIVDANKESIAVAEAINLSIPIVAIIDTNSNPQMINYPIPANDDATKSLTLLLGAVKSALAGSKEAYAMNQQEIAREQAEKEAAELKVKKDAEAKAAEPEKPAEVKETKVKKTATKK